MDDPKPGRKASGYVATDVGWRGLQVASINRELQVLRRLLHLAAEWGFVEQIPKIRMLSGERHREFVLLPEEEGRYLAVADDPLGFRGTVLADTGMRPEECYRLRWEYVTWVNGRCGIARLVTQRKDRMRAPTRCIDLELGAAVTLEAAGKPVEGQSGRRLRGAVIWNLAVWKVPIRQSAEARRSVRSSSTA